jgi:hypothetical protein
MMKLSLGRRPMRVTAHMTDHCRQANTSRSSISKDTETMARPQMGGGAPAPAEVEDSTRDPWLVLHLLPAPVPVRYQQQVPDDQRCCNVACLGHGCAPDQQQSLERVSGA